jgi:Tfp pilus assembly protein PilF
MQLKWRLSHARGYIELGMLDEAEAELARVSPEDADKMEVLALHVAILHERHDWEKLRVLAETLVSRNPEYPDWWITWAYAARRSINLVAAESILRKAEQLHPTNATIQFNLGCYACQLGNLIAARARIAKAIQLDENFRAAADSDPDLEPLREFPHP